MARRRLMSAWKAASTRVARRRAAQSLQDGDEVLLRGVVGGPRRRVPLEEEQVLEEGRPDGVLVEEAEAQAVRACVGRRGLEPGPEFGLPGQQLLPVLDLGEQAGSGDQVGTEVGHVARTAAARRDVGDANGLFGDAPDPRIGVEEDEQVVFECGLVANAPALDVDASGHAAAANGDEPARSGMVFVVDGRHGPGIDGSGRFRRVEHPAYVRFPSCRARLFGEIPISGVRIVRNSFLPVGTIVD